MRGALRGCNLQRHLAQNRTFSVRCAAGQQACPQVHLNSLNIQEKRIILSDVGNFQKWNTCRHDRRRRGEQIMPAYGTGERCPGKRMFGV